MKRVVEVRETSRPIGEVFAYVADFTTAAEYDPGVVAARRLTDGPVALGSAFHVEARFLGRVVPMRYEVLALEAPTRLRLEGVAAAARTIDEIRFEARPEGGTRVTWTLDLELGGAGRLAEPVLGPVLRRLGRAALDGLAARLADPRPLVPAR